MTAASIPWPVQLGITAVCTGLSSLIFIFVYVQLWLLLRYKQKRLSYQSGLLFLCLIWAACRTVLLSFYLTNCARRGNELQPFPHWLLYCAPICLQFFILCLLNLYFAEVVFKARCSPEYNRYELPLQFGFLIISLVFLIVNLSCILLGDYSTDDKRERITMTRVIISDGLFGACALCLTNNTCKIYKTSPAYVYLESKGSSGSQTVVTGSVISALYLLRASYNLVVVFMRSNGKPTPFSYGWNGVYDYVDREDVNGLDYLLFGIALLVCELIPMIFIAYYFQAKKLSQNLQEPSGMVNSHSFGSRAYFFDNPRRYDSDDDLPRLAGTRGGDRGSSSSTPKTSGWYGAICPTSGCALAPPLMREPSGTPVLFTCGANGLA